MTKEELQSQLERLSKADTEADIYDTLRVFMEFLFRTMQVHNPSIEPDAGKRHAMLVAQMMFTKIAHLEKHVGGVNYTADNGDQLNTIIDPTIISAQIRAIFETVGMFNVVNVLPATEDERLIVQNLWIIAGLKYRQKLATGATSEENLEKAATEQKEIVRLTSEIEQTVLFKGLSQRDKDKIYNRISSKEYSIRFENNKVIFLEGFQDAVKLTGVKDKVMANMYTYLSLNAHPSNVAVFQFAEMFFAERPEYFELAKFNLDLGYMLLSIFVADYIKIFPEIKAVFESLDIVQQNLINFFNFIVRGEEYTINNSLDSIG